MRKIDLLVLLPVILTKGVYASGSGNYFGGWLFGDNNNRIPTTISPAAFFGTDVLQRSPVDSISNLEGRIRSLRLPRSSVEDSFLSAFRNSNLVRREPVTELVHVVETNRNALLFRNNVLNGITNNTTQYDQVSIYIDEENSIVEIFLDKKGRKTAGTKTCIVALICALKKYGRDDIVKKFNNEGFFE